MPDNTSKFDSVGSRLHVMYMFSLHLHCSCMYTTCFFVCFFVMTEFFSAINPFPNKPWFLRVCSTSLLKTLWEKEKLLVTSNFSFSNSVFYPFEDFCFPFLSNLKLSSANSFSLEEFERMILCKAVFRPTIKSCKNAVNSNPSII